MGSKLVQDLSFDFLGRSNQLYLVNPADKHRQMDKQAVIKIVVTYGKRECLFLVENYYKPPKQYHSQTLLETMFYSMSQSFCSI